MHNQTWPYLRALVVGLVLAMVLAAFPYQTRSASAEPPPDIVQPASSFHVPEATPPSQRGFKSWLIKQAVQLIAEAIRHGSRIFDLIVGKLDAKAARAFRKHAGDIADGLDDIARIPDLTVNIVREKLRYFLVQQLHMSHGTAGVNLEGVTYALGLLL